MGQPLKYSIDTSSILDSWRRSYPPTHFPLFWKNIQDLIENDQLIASEEVLVELEKKDDEIYSWAKEQPKLIIPIDADIQKNVKLILKKYPRLLDTRKNRSGADPFVIALAIIQQPCVVITNEVVTGSNKRPHIPDVCTDFGIKSINVLDLIKSMKWVF